MKIAFSFSNLFLDKEATMGCIFGFTQVSNFQFQSNHIEKWGVKDISRS